MATAQANPFFTPTQISGCQLWLDAADVNSFVLSGTTITRWNDKSGNGRNATASGSPILRPNSINGQSSIFYDGVVSTTFSGTISITTSSIFAFAVFISNLNVGNEGMRIISFTGPGCADWNCSTTVIPFLYDTNRIQTWRNSSTTTNLTCPAVGSTILTTTYYDGSIAYNSLFGGSSSSAISSSGSFNISNYAMTFGNVNMKGYLAEVIVFTSVLSTTQRQQIEGYLAWKWGLQSSLSANHPYKTSPIPPLLSPPVTIPVTIQSITPITWNPNAISGLQLWFDAADSGTFVFSSGSNIQVWQDKSPNKYSVSQTNASLQPTLASSAQNSLPGVQLTTSAYLFTAGSNIPNFSVGSETSVFLAVRNASANSGWNIVNTMWFTGISNATTRYHFSFNQGATTGTTLFVNNAIVGQVTSNATPVNSNALLGFTASGTSASIHTNGSVNTYGGVTLPNANNATYFMFGDARNNTALSSNIMIFEMVGYNRQVTSSEREQIEGYLAWKWGLQGSLPATQPYKIFPPFLPTLAYPPRSVATLGTWNPTRFSGCALWVDAKTPTSFTPSTGGTLTAARDNSPSPKTITITNTVTYVPNTEIVFTNTTGIFTLSGMPSAPYDFLFVGTANSSTSTYRTMLRTNSSPGTHPFLLQVNTDNAGMWNGSAFYQFGSLTQLPSEKAMFYGSMATNRTITASKNGTIALTAASPAGNESVITCLGNSIGGGQPYGSLQEIVLYSQTLTTAQRQQVEGYLAWKWGLQGLLPAAHPWKNWPPAP